MKQERDTAVIEVSVTDSDKRAVRMLAAGKSVPEIAKALNTNSRAIEYQLSKLKGRLQCETAAQLVAVFMRNKFID